MTFDPIAETRPHEFATNLADAWDLLVNGTPIAAIAERVGTDPGCITFRLSIVVCALIRHIKAVHEAETEADASQPRPKLQ